MTEPNEAEKATALRLAKAWHCPEAPETVSDDKSWVMAAYLEGVLAGYRAELTQPAHVLAEAERLLREAGVHYIEFCPYAVPQLVWELGTEDDIDGTCGNTFAETYAKLTEKRHE